MTAHNRFAAKLWAVIDRPYRRVCITLLFVAIVAPAWSQSRTVTIDRDVRLFTMMAAINAAGFDVELGAESHPVRQEIRKIASELDPAFVARLRQFYQIHKGSQSDELQLPKYIGLALALSGAPNFELTVREEAMPPDARSVVRFAEFLKEFFVKAHIPERWVLARPFYDSEAALLGPPIRDSIRLADAYLRATTGTVTVRRMTVFVELSAPKNSVNVQNAQDEYYVIVGNSAIPRAADIRHAYLHLSVDAALSSTMSVISNAQSLLGLIAKEDSVPPEIKSDLFSMTRESLIRAVELRLDKPGPAERREIMNGHYRSGLLLLPFFYDALAAYVQEDDALTAYLPTMLGTLKVKDEQKRFQDTFHSIPPPARTTRVVESPAAPSSPTTPPPPPSNPMRTLLVEGSAAYNAGEMDKARKAFEKVLESYERDNGAALYGLALISGKEGDDVAAQKYFEGVTRSASSEPAIKVWAYIYLGRLNDIDCERKLAIENYQEAIKIGADTNNAQATAKEGLAHPFGDMCK